jgi:mRNA interferase RelE/StbE
MNSHHPSLRTKKYEGVESLWQARVTRNWQFYFTIERHSYNLVDITSHPK